MTAHAFNPRPQPSAVPAWEPVRIRRRVAIAALQEGWTPHSSLALVQAILRGAGGLDRAVAVTGRSRDACLAQWNLLFPMSYRGGIDNQAALLAALRALCAATDLEGAR